MLIKLFTKIVLLCVIATYVFAGEITVAAAADLVFAFKEIGEVYEKDSGNKVKFIFSSSGTAKEQIINGAPYDVYASANVQFVDELIKANLAIKETKELYGIGRIGFATLKGSTKVVNVNDLLKDDIKKIAIANPSHAPYGLAAKESLIKLGVWDKIQNKIVYGKDIQDTMALVRTGNADCGIIALSIIKKSEVDFTLINETNHNPLKQGIVVIKNTKNEKEAREFIKYVNGDKGRNIMKKYGFILPGEI